MRFTTIHPDSRTARRSRAVQLARRLCGLLVGAGAVLSIGVAAWAFWNNGGSGDAAAATGTLNAPSNVLASAPMNSATVAVSWTGATLATGQPATGYYVMRVRNSDEAAFPACDTTPAAPTSALGCNDLGVTDGTYHYTVTALFGSWTAVSPAGNNVTVVHDISPPTITVTSVSPNPNGNGYNNSSPVVVNLSASDSSGIASITYAVDSGSPVAVLSSTAAISVSGNGVHTVTFSATDNVGNTSATGSNVVRIDTVAPSAPSAPALATASDTGASSSDRITKITNPTFTGTAEDGATVALYDGATPVGSGLASGGSYTIISSTLANGTHAMTAKATDVAGNLGPASTSTSITIDITAPAAPGTPALTAASDSGRSATDKNTKVTTPTVTGSTTAGYLVTLYDGGTEVASTTAATTTYSLTSLALTDAVHSITTTNTDVAGNLGPASTAISVTIDTIAPLAPSVPKANAASDTGKSSTDGITKITTPVITGTNETKAIVTLYDAATQIGILTTTSTTYSITSPTLGEGAHTLTATSTDIAGNLGPASAGGSLTVDTIAPTTSASTPMLATASDTGISSSDQITKVTTPVFTGTAGTGDTVTLYDAAAVTGTPVTVAGGAYSIATTALSNGSHTVTAVDTDVAGNAAPTMPGTVVTIDTVAPTVTLNQAAGQDDPTTSSPINFTVLFSETVATLSSASVTYTGTALATTSTITGSGATYNVATSGMTRTGTVIPAIAASKVTDVAGNNNTAATFTDKTVTYNDTTAPAAPSTPFLSAASDTGSSSIDGVTKLTTPTFTGTAEVGSTVKLFDGVTQVGSVVATVGTYSTATSALSNGTHTITATATDSSTNVSLASSSTSVTIDTIVPTVTLNQAAGQADPTTTSPINFTAVFSETVTGFSSAGVTYTGTALATTSTITGSGATYNVATSGMTKTGTVIPAIAAAKATDIAGNSNTAATFTDKTVTYTDNVAPTVVITSFAAGPSQTATASGTAGFGLGDPTTVTVVLCTVNAFPCAVGNTKATLTPTVSATTGDWSISSATLGTLATLYAKATQSDLTGNIGNSAVAGPITIP